MSMRDYGVDDYGLVIDEKTGMYMATKAIKDYDKNVDEWEYCLYEEGICEYISDFTGETNVLLDDGNPNWSESKYYNTDVICYVSVERIPTLFKKAYNNIDDIIEEMKRKIGEYLPEDYDYRNNICKITGTYYG